MQWDSTIHVGFTSADPWLPVASDFARFNVATETHEADSSLTLHRRLIALRAQKPALHTGVYGEIMCDDHVLSYSRESGPEQFLVVLNFTGAPRTFEHRSLRGRISLTTAVDRTASWSPKSLSCALTRASLSKSRRDSLTTPKLRLVCWGGIARTLSRFTRAVEPDRAISRWHKVCENLFAKRWLDSHHGTLRGILVLSRAQSGEPVITPFADRRHAGKTLAAQLASYANRSDLLVLGLPRGGVPVAYEVARALHAPLDVFLVRKLGVPGDEELAMGAIASGGVRILNEEVTSRIHISDSTIDEVAGREQQELERRERLYRGDQAAPDVQGRTVILVDDGLATGSTMRAAAVAVRQMRPSKIIVAVPVAAAETCAELRSEVDDVVCGATPEPFMAVGAWYSDFEQTSDDEVRKLLHLSESSPHENPKLHL